MPGLRMLVMAYGPRRDIDCNRKWHAHHQQDHFYLIVRGRLLDPYDPTSPRVPLDESLHHNRIFQCMTCTRYVTYDFGCDIGHPDLSPERRDLTAATIPAPALAALRYDDWILRESCDDCWARSVPSHP
jgi:hypothetical protein